MEARRRVREGQGQTRANLTLAGGASDHHLKVVALEDTWYDQL